MMALNGEFSLYKTDSLSSKYNKQEFIKRVGAYLKEDSILPLASTKISSLEFVSSYSGKFNASSSSNQFRALTLFINPGIKSLVIYGLPKVLLSAEELKLKLSDEDYQFILLLYNFGLEEPGHQRYYDSYNPYYLRLMYKKTYMIVDSVLLKHISETMTSNYCFLRYLPNYDNIRDTADYMLFEKYSKQYVPLQLIRYRFYRNEKIFLSTDPNDPTIGVDTVILSPILSETLQKTFIDETTGLIAYFTYNFEYENNQKGELQFPRAMFLKYEPSEIAIWFLEDYYRTQYKH